MWTNHFELFSNNSRRRKYNVDHFLLEEIKRLHIPTAKIGLSSKVRSKYCRVLSAIVLVQPSLNLFTVALVVFKNPMTCVLNVVKYLWTISVIVSGQTREVRWVTLLPLNKVSEVVSVLVDSFPQNVPFARFQGHTPIVLKLHHDYPNVEVPGVQVIELLFYELNIFVEVIGEKYWCFLNDGLDVFLDLICLLSRNLFW